MANTAFTRLSGKTSEAQKTILLCKALEKLYKIQYYVNNNHEKSAKISAVYVRNLYKLDKDAFDVYGVESDIDNLHDSIVVGFSDNKDKLARVKDLATLNQTVKNLTKKIQSLENYLVTQKDIVYTDDDTDSDYEPPRDDNLEVELNTVTDVDKTIDSGIAILWKILFVVTLISIAIQYYIHVI